MGAGIAASTRDLRGDLNREPALPSWIWGSPPFRHYFWGEETARSMAAEHYLYRCAVRCEGASYSVSITSTTGILFTMQPCIFLSWRASTQTLMSVTLICLALSLLGITTNANSHAAYDVLGFAIFSGLALQ